MATALQPSRVVSNVEVCVYCGVVQPGAPPPPAPPAPPTPPAPPAPPVVAQVAPRGVPAATHWASAATSSLVAGGKPYGGIGLVRLWTRASATWALVLLALLLAGFLRSA